MTRLFTLLFVGLISFSMFGQRNCGTMEVLERLEREDPGIKESMDQIEAKTRFFVDNHKEVTGVVTIPVVVHVVYNNSTENISSAQIQSQIDVLNDDFRRLNSDASNTPSDFIGVAADVQIEFCLASVDPSGNSTTGITRTSTNVSAFGTNDAMKFSSQGGKDAWPTSSYLNIWVCDISGGILGYAQFPGGPASTDGVVVDYAYFGTTGTATAPFNLGRTATHEVGHWLNLRHIWGDGGCSVDDFVNDTPEAGGPNYTGAPCTYPGPNSCRPKGRNKGNDLPDMFMNYMDYSDDGCMNMFTSGQTSRMRALFDVGGPRASLLSSNGCGNGGGNPPTPTCTDGIQNGNETGIDCGGPDCPPCNTGTCGDPTGLNANSRKGGREVVLNWNAVQGATNYNLTFDVTGGSSPVTGTIGSTSATISGTSKNTSYTWTVTANCNGTLSNTVSSSFTARLANSLSGFDEIKMYPNPTAGLVGLEYTCETAEDVTVYISDVTGRIMQAENVQAESGSNYHEFDVSGLPTGVYIVSLEVNGERMNIRLMKE